jgi:hypothetical protein
MIRAFVIGGGMHDLCWVHDVRRAGTILGASEWI